MSESVNMQILQSPGNVSDFAGTSERAAMTTAMALKVPARPCRCERRIDSHGGPHGLAFTRDLLQVDAVEPAARLKKDFRRYEDDRVVLWKIVSGIYGVLGTRNSAAEPRCREKGRGTLEWTILGRGGPGAHGRQLVPSERKFRPWLMAMTMRLTDSRLGSQK
jgi:hypothetical protein